MIVVADTSPLNYLIQIGCESLLPALYKRVVVPSAVLSELSHAIRKWLLDVPNWIEIRDITSQPDAALAFLDPGEREAIQLARSNTQTCY